MKILVVKNENKVLNTETSSFETSKSFDENCDGKPIFFNLHKEGKILKCSVADGRNIRNEVDYNDMLDRCVKAGIEPMIHLINKTTKKEVVVNRQDYEKVSKSAKENNKAVAEKKKEEGRFADKKAIFTKNLSAEQREEIKKENVEAQLKKEGSLRDGIVIDFNNLKETINERAKNMYQDVLYKAMQFTAPFYNGVLMSIDHKFTDSKRVCPTMGVTTKEIVINNDFIIKQTMGEVFFTLCHEASHIVLKHPAREHKKIHNLWNIAGDLIINKALCEEFGLTPDKATTVEFNGNSYPVEFPHGSLYVDEVDLDKDTTESIYDELYEEYKKQKEEQQKQKQQNQQQGGGESGQGDSGESGDEDENESGNGGGNSKDDNKDKGNKDNKNSDGGNGGNDENDDIDDNDENGNGGGNQDQEEGDDENDNEEGNGGGSGNDEHGEEDSENGEDGADEGDGEIEIDFRGTKVKFKPEEHGDVMQSTEDREKIKDALGGEDSGLDNDVKELEKECEKVVEAGIQTMEMNSKQYGSGKGLMQRLYELGKYKPIKWWKMLQKHLVRGLRQDKTWNRLPRTKYSVSGIIQRGRVKPKNKLRKLLIAVDTSGSMTDELIAEINTQVNTLLNKYKDVEGMICYWDTGIASKGVFKNIKQYKNTDIKGGGGTDVNCVFQLCREEDILIPIIFTDGYFSRPDTSRISQAVKNNTIWVLESRQQFEDFNKPFGTKTM